MANEQLEDRKYAAERDTLTLIFWQSIGQLVLFGSLWPYRETISGARDFVLLFSAMVIVFGLMTWIGFHFTEEEQ